MTAPRSKVAQGVDTKMSFILVLGSLGSTNHLTMILLWALPLDYMFSNLKVVGTVFGLMLCHDRTK